MMRDAGHFDQIKKLRILDKDLVHLADAYDVRTVVASFHRTDLRDHLSFQTALTKLKESYQPHWQMR